MPMRLQEIHPALVHFPIALLPVSLGADVLGRATGDRSLLDVGKWGMALTAGSAAIAGFFGFVAQEEVETEGESHDILVTHRTLNVAFVGLSAALAARRLTVERPSLPYLAASLSGLGTLLYSAYLGGRMVYEHGVGVVKAGGVRDGEAPELAAGLAGEIARRAAEDAVHGLRHGAEHAAEGDLVPALRNREEGTGGPEGPRPTDRRASAED